MSERKKRGKENRLQDERYNVKYCKNILKIHEEFDEFQRRFFVVDDATNANAKIEDDFIYVIDNLRHVKYKFYRNEFLRLFSNESTWKILSSGHCLAFPMREYFQNERDNDVLIYAWFDLDKTTDEALDLHANVFVRMMEKLLKKKKLDNDSNSLKWLVLQNENTKNYHVYTNVVMERSNWLSLCVSFCDLLKKTDYEIDYAVENISLPFSTKHDRYGVYKTIVAGNVDDVSGIFTFQT